MGKKRFRASAGNATITVLGCPSDIAGSEGSNWSFCFQRFDFLRLRKHDVRQKYLQVFQSQNDMVAGTRQV